MDEIVPMPEWAKRAAEVMRRDILRRARQAAYAAVTLSPPSIKE